MRVLLIGTDEKVFEENSNVQNRLKNYSSHLDYLTQVVLVKSERSLVQTDKMKIVPVLNTGKLSIFRLLKTALKQDPMDVVSTQDPAFLGLVGWIVSKRKKAVLHLQIHTDIANSDYTKSLRGKIEWLVARCVIKKAKRVRAVSNRVVENILKRLEVPRSLFSVLPIYVGNVSHDEVDLRTEEKLKNFTNRHELNILIMSRLEGEKRVEYCLEAFKKLVGKGHKVGLVVVGEGSRKIALKKFVEKNGLTEHVVFFEWTNTPELFYRNCDILWSNSLYEGFGMTIIESLANGCPVLSSDVGIAKEVIINGQNGFVYGVHDKKKLFEILENIVHDMTQVRSMKGKDSNVDNVMSYANEEDYTNRIVSDWQNII